MVLECEGVKVYNDLIDLIGLGNRITRMRMTKKMTQFELAEMTGLSEVYIGYIERGKRRAALDTYIKIVNALGYTLDDLIGEYLTSQDTVSLNLKELLEDCRIEERKLILRLIKEMVDLVHIQRLD
jgi:transcriptional regulator with XRE-family HTH domain